MHFAPQLAIARRGLRRFLFGIVVIFRESGFFGGWERGGGRERGRRGGRRQRRERRSASARWRRTRRIAASALERARREERKGTSRGACENLSVVRARRTLSAALTTSTDSGAGSGSCESDGRERVSLRSPRSRSGKATHARVSRSRVRGGARRCRHSARFRRSAGGKGNVHACGSVPSSRPRCGPSASPSTRASASATPCLWSVTSSRPSPLHRAPRGLTTRAPFSGLPTIPGDAKSS